jgi:hypothetical protein
MSTTATATGPFNPQEKSSAAEMAAAGYLIVAAGGTGRDAMPLFDLLYRRDGEPFAKWLLQIDTENVRSAVVDDFACIRMTAGDIRAIQSDPEMFGLVAQTVVEHYPHLLREDSLQHGARTARRGRNLGCEPESSTV